VVGMCKIVYCIAHAVASAELSCFGCLVAGDREASLLTKTRQDFVPKTATQRVIHVRMRAESPRTDVACSSLVCTRVTQQVCSETVCNVHVTMFWNDDYAFGRKNSGKHFSHKHSCISYTFCGGFFITEYAKREAFNLIQCECIIITCDY
jgi:hypothetical protein